MCTNPSAVSLIYCRGIAEPVFSMLDAETELLLQQSPKAFNCFGNLIIVDGSITGISSSAELISYLTDSYQTHVDLDEFSKTAFGANLVQRIFSTSSM